MAETIPLMAEVKTLMQCKQITALWQCAYMCADNHTTRIALLQRLAKQTTQVRSGNHVQRNMNMATCAPQKSGGKEKITCTIICMT